MYQAEFLRPLTCGKLYQRKLTMKILPVPRNLYKKTCHLVQI